MTDHDRNAYSPERMEGMRNLTPAERIEHSVRMGFDEQNMFHFVRVTLTPVPPRPWWRRLLDHLR